MISKLFAVVLALVFAGVQIGRGAWVEAIGLLGLAAGLAIVRFWPAGRWLGWACFGVTVVSISVVLSRVLSVG